MKYEHPFANVYEAWFWTIGSLNSRITGQRGDNPKRIVRPCDPDDVVNSLNVLYKEGHITLEHVRVLKAFGDMNREPNPTVNAEKAAYELWTEVMQLLSTVLKKKGIIENKRRSVPKSRNEYDRHGELSV